MDLVAEQNKEAVKSKIYSSDWHKLSTQFRGTIIGPWQNLDRLQGIKKTALVLEECE